MHIHWFQHVPFEGLGTIADWAAARGHVLSVTRFCEPHGAACAVVGAGLIVMGGPMSVHDGGRFPWLTEEKRRVEQAIQAGQPVLGICLGAQLIAEVLGARVTPNPEKEIGWFPVEWTPAAATDGWLAGVGKLGPAHGASGAQDGAAAVTEVFQWHGETFELPRGAEFWARSRACRNQAFRYGARVVGLQFHLESTPASIRALIDHCPDDLAPGPYVQTPEEMLQNGGRFAAARTMLFRLLDGLFAERRR
jgi:GMP synthase-like glutamine amidotransferase